MKEITKKAVAKFINAQSFKQDNTQVKVLPNVTTYSEHKKLWMVLTDNQRTPQWYTKCKYLSKERPMVFEWCVMGRRIN